MSEFKKPLEKNEQGKGQSGQHTKHGHNESQHPKKAGKDCSSEKECSSSKEEWKKEKK